MNEHDEYQPASSKKRVAARAVDTVVTAVLAVVVLMAAGVTALVVSLYVDGWGGDRDTFWLTLFWLLALIPIARYEVAATGNARVVSVTDTAPSVEYTAPDADGTDSFTYEVCDRLGACATAQVTVTVGTTGCTIVGTDASETLYGTTGNDVICGLGGDDTIYGLGGDDIIVGGAGSDSLYGGDASLTGAHDGDDSLEGNTQNDSLWGGDGDDDLYGAGHDDWLYGGAGDDAVPRRRGRRLRLRQPGRRHRRRRRRQRLPPRRRRRRHLHPGRDGCGVRDCRWPQRCRIDARSMVAPGLRGFA